ncbi:hypothetical protein MOMA_07156 [Moraxella macacae 0408225]|uniref:TsaA-like domain-containing protein n=1 Tax=Moraxella macacae 0408225 TaxID=1230338 RepID=L2F699_9GAMM|nr:tRNA (N6-threonylcarbamoyladenosine(37)-N6)-methyltransferase TrmO [Moraxella macacae]ELA08321.1 hypothetical protein MOMA_07156 [Moraxella macacae 0408225]
MPKNINHQQIQLPIIGYLRSPLCQKFGLPRQPNLVNLAGVIELIPPFDNPDAFVGLQEFSHIWLIWQFHQNKTAANLSFRPQVRPPRLGGNAKLGVFATRSMYRPANIGLSVVLLQHIEQNNHSVRLHVVGADLVDGTPIIDIKPYIVYSDSLPHAISGFASDKPALKKLVVSETAQQNFANLKKQRLLTENDIATISALIAQDPRPAYRQTEINSKFTLQYQQVDVCFCMLDNNALQIVSAVKINNKTNNA